MIRAKSRASLTPIDMEYILRSLSGSDRERNSLTELMSEKDFLDHLLDRPELFDRVVNERELAQISPNLYFYLLTRHGLVRWGIDDRNVSDYIAALLVEFTVRERMYRVSMSHDEVFGTVVDLLGHLDGADLRNRFLIRTHIGNYSLFLSGLFIDYVEGGHERRRCLPGVNYYEDMGSTNYRLAAGNDFAAQLDLVDVLTVMAHRFHDIRQALNQTTRQYLHLHSQG